MVLDSWIEAISCLKISIINGIHKTLPKLFVAKIIFNFSYCVSKESFLARLVCLSLNEYNSGVHNKTQFWIACPQLILSWLKKHCWVICSVHFYKIINVLTCSQITKFKIFIKETQTTSIIENYIWILVRNCNLCRCRLYMC